MESTSSDLLNILPKKNKKRGACALSGPFNCFFDHTLPIASMLNIPLITSDPYILLTYKGLYPKFKYKLCNWFLPDLLEEYSTFFYGFNFEEQTFQDLLSHVKKKHPNHPGLKLPHKFIYHFHGCSDKLWFSDNGRHLAQADEILFYGNRMVDLFKKTNIYNKINSYSFIGNYRYAYYKRHKHFFDLIADKFIFSLFEKKQSTLLYAPTWKDRADSSSIFKAYADILGNLPDNYNLLVKLHPNLTLPTQGYDPKLLVEMLDPYARRPNIQIAPLFPCVYPILNKVNAYVGDYSSVGYDALAFDLPMFFINHNKRSPIHDTRAHLLQAGRNIYTEDLKEFYSILEKELPGDSAKYSKIRKEIYEYGFGKDLTYEETQKRLQSLLI